MIQTDVLKVVSCPYYPIQQGKDVESNKVIGIFVVLYTEAKDSQVLVPQNVVALKVTTARPYTKAFVPVNNSTILMYGDKVSDFSFRKESYVLCSHFNVLPLNNCTVLGELSIEDSIKILDKVSEFSSIMIHQCYDNLQFKAQNKG